MMRKLWRLYLKRGTILAPIQELENLAEFGKRKRMQGRHEGALMALAALDAEIGDKFPGHYMGPGLNRAIAVIEEVVEQTNHEVSEFRQAGKGDGGTV